LPEQSGSAVMKNVRKYEITSLTIHLAGFALGTISIALVFSGNIGMESGLAMLTPFADALYGLGLVMVVAVAARAGLPMKYLFVVGGIIGVGLFYKSAPHEFHVASGIGFGLPHNGHVVMGTIVITLSVVALAVLTLVYNRYRIQGDRTG
jgi:hypothetical protein